MHQGRSRDTQAEKAYRVRTVDAPRRYAGTLKRRASDWYIGPSQFTSALMERACLIRKFADSSGSFVAGSE